jgi:hypothetical protein
MNYTQGAPAHRSTHSPPNTSHTMKYHAAQYLLPLTQAVTSERGISLVCIPDRFAAENSLTRLQVKHGANLIKATIRKDKPGKDSTYTLRYFLRETQQVRLF